MNHTIGIPSLIVASAVPSKTEATLATKTAESATDVASSVAHGNKDSVESSKPTKLLSGLVAYGDDSDSDVDT